jgi:hypothetical protein
MKYWSWRNLFLEVEIGRLTVNRASFVALGSRNGVVVVETVVQIMALPLRQLINVEIRLLSTLLQLLEWSLSCKDRVDDGLFSRRLRIGSRGSRPESVASCRSVGGLALAG